MARCWAAGALRYLVVVRAAAALLGPYSAPLPSRPVAEPPFTPEQIEQRRRELRRSWIVTERMLARPGFEDMLRERLAELDRRYPRD